MTPIPLPLSREIVKLIFMLAYYDMHEAFENPQMTGTLRSTVTRMPGTKVRYALVMENEEVNRKATVAVIEDEMQSSVYMCISLHEAGKDAKAETVKSKIIAEMSLKGEKAHELRMLSIIGNVRHKWNSITHPNLLAALKIVSSWLPTHDMVDMNGVLLDFEHLYESPPILVTN